MDDDARPESSCGPAADTDAGYLTPVEDEGERGADDDTDELATTENSSSMRTKSSFTSLKRWSLVDQTLLRP